MQIIGLEKIGKRTEKEIGKWWDSSALADRLQEEWCSKAFNIRKGDFYTFESFSPTFIECECIQAAVVDEDGDLIQDNIFELRRYRDSNCDWSFEKC